MKTEELIEKISKHHQAISPLATPWVRFVRWFLLSVLFFSMTLSFLGLRHDFHEVMFSFSFLFQSALLIIGVILSGVSAFLLSIPGRKLWWHFSLPFSTVLLWLSFLIYQILSGSGFHFSMGLGCIKDLFLLSFFPAVFLLWMIKKAAPLKLGKSGFFAILAASSFGALGSQMTCKLDDPTHLILWHVFPLVAFSSLGIWIGKKFLKKI